jgi:hypothetical protein
VLGSLLARPNSRQARLPRSLPGSSSRIARPLSHPRPHPTQMVAVGRIRWLNAAEMEARMVGRQCLGKRHIPDFPTLVQEVKAWRQVTTREGMPIRWKFRVKDARRVFRYDRLNPDGRNTSLRKDAAVADAITWC